MPDKRFIILANRRARSLLEADIAEEFQRRMTAGFALHRVDAEVRLVEPDGLVQAVRDALQERPDALLSAGGDGTVRTFAAELRGTDIPLGIVPCGTFNLLARDLGVPLTPDEAIPALATADKSPIDFGEVEGHVFLCSCMVGYFPEKLMTQDRFRGLAWWSKTAVALQALWGSYFDFRPLKLSVEADGGSAEFQTRFAVVANNPYDDQPGLLPTRQRLDRGRLGLYVSTHRTRWGSWRAAMRFLAGRLKEDPGIRIVSAESVVLDTRRPQLSCRIDGDIVRLTTPLKFECRHRQLLVLKPRPPESES